MRGFCIASVRHQRPADVLGAALVEVLAVDTPTKKTPRARCRLPILALGVASASTIARIVPLEPGDSLARYAILLGILRADEGHAAQALS
jgi:hypothetical protein